MRLAGQSGECCRTANSKNVTKSLGLQMQVSRPKVVIHCISYVEQYQRSQGNRKKKKMEAYAHGTFFLLQNLPIFPPTGHLSFQVDIEDVIERKKKRLCF